MVNDIDRFLCPRLRLGVSALNNRRYFILSKFSVVRYIRFRICETNGRNLLHCGIIYRLLVSVLHVYLEETIK